jgi:hypothetical protein
MARKTVIEAEFEIKKDGILHMPTGTWFYPYAGTEELKNVRHGNYFLASGDTYSEKEVEAMAVRLWASRKK